MTSSGWWTWSPRSIGAICLFRMAGLAARCARWLHASGNRVKPATPGVVTFSPGAFVFNFTDKEEFERRAAEIISEVFERAAAHADARDYGTVNTCHATIEIPSDGDPAIATTHDDPKVAASVEEALRELSEDPVYVKT